MAGQRLDRALEEVFPQSGLRARRRIISDGHVKVNGSVARSAQRLCIGDLLETEFVYAPPQYAGNVRLMENSGEYCFFYKPSHMHTCSLAGKNNTSLEAILPTLVSPMPHLLQRLDFGTSGIVAAAFSTKACTSFRAAETGGFCRKYYLALLDGILERELHIAFALDANGGRRVRVLRTEADKTRQTVIEPIKIWESPLSKTPVTVALCEISRGKRHQIRAHAAAAGFPLLGDDLYGNTPGAKNITGCFFLEHVCLQFSRYSIDCTQCGAFASILPVDILNESLRLLERKKSRAAKFG